MKRIARSRIGLCVLYAAVCGATAWSVGDDAVDVPDEPMPLFSPPNSLRPLQGPQGISHGANVESKDELYERLRQSLLALEHRLQENEQAAEPDADPHADTPSTQTPQDEHGESTLESHAADSATTVPLFNPMTSEEAHDEEAPHVAVPIPDPPATGESPETIETPDEVESTHESESSDPESEPSTHESESSHTDETDHHTASPFVSHPGSIATPPLISPEALGSPNIPALADSLYAIGEYQLAYGSYQEIDHESLNEEDKVWVTYQLAGCLRHLGESESAASLYRQILADHPNHYLSDVSRWWLDAMDEYSRQTQALDALRTSILKIEETRDAVAAP